MIYRERAVNATGRTGKTCSALHQKPVVFLLRRYGNVAILLCENS